MLSSTGGLQIPPSSWGEGGLTKGARQEYIYWERGQRVSIQPSTPHLLIMNFELAHPSCPVAEGICVTEDVRTSDEFVVSDNDDRHRAYAQWVSIEIINYRPRPVKIKNVYKSWGKLYIEGQ